MHEARSSFDDLDEMKERVESLGADFLDHYAFRDIFFLPTEGTFDLNRRSVRLRVSDVSAKPVSRFVLTEKQTVWSGSSKTSELVLERAFDTQREALVFVETHYRGTLQRSFEYFREGWRYRLYGNLLFIEDIKVEKLKPTIEIGAENPDDLARCFERLGLHELISDSVPGLVRKHLCGLFPGREFPTHRVVRAMLFDARRGVLVGQRARGDQAGRWALIGGKVEAEEDPEDAIMREVREEIDVTCYPRFYRELIDVQSDPSTPWLATIFVGTFEGVPRPKYSEINAIAFVTADTLHQFSFAFNHGRILAELFAAKGV